MKGITSETFFCIGAVAFFVITAIYQAFVYLFH